MIHSTDTLKLLCLVYRTLFQLPVFFLFKTDKTQVILFIVEQKQKYKRYRGKGYINIRHIEDRKIDQHEVNKIHHIIQTDPVDHITDGTRCNQA